VSGDIIENVLRNVVQDINLDLELVPTQRHHMVVQIVTVAPQKLQLAMELTVQVCTTLKFINHAFSGKFIYCHYFLIENMLYVYSRCCS